MKTLWDLCRACVTWTCWAVALRAISGSAQPTNLALVSSWPERRWEQADGLFVHGDYAYVLHGWDDLSVLDISDFQQPRRLGSYRTGGHPNHVTVVDGMVYMTDGTNGLTAWQPAGVFTIPPAGKIVVTDPEKPMTARRYFRAVSSANPLP